MIEIPEKGETWQHYKGNHYEILGVGYSERGTPVVIYAEAGTGGAKIYSRDLSNFLSTLEDHKCRFVRIRRSQF